MHTHFSVHTNFSSFLVRSLSGLQYLNSFWWISYSRTPCQEYVSFVLHYLVWATAIILQCYHDRISPLHLIPYTVVMWLFLWKAYIIFCFNFRFASRISITLSLCCSKLVSWTIISSIQIMAVDHFKHCYINSIVLWKLTELPTNGIVVNSYCPYLVRSKVFGISMNL